MYKVIFFVPTNEKELVKEAMFAAGGGTLGHYEHCCFETEGVGQFRATQGASPHVGEIGKLCRLQETRVEMMVISEKITDVLKALIGSHPYEEVAYDVFKQAEVAL